MKLRKILICTLAVLAVFAAGSCGAQKTNETSSTGSSAQAVTDADTGDGDEEDSPEKQAALKFGEDVDNAYSDLSDAEWDISEGLYEGGEEGLAALEAFSGALSAFGRIEAPEALDSAYSEFLKEIKRCEDILPSLKIYIEETIPALSLYEEKYDAIYDLYDIADEFDDPELYADNEAAEEEHDAYFDALTEKIDDFYFASIDVDFEYAYTENDMSAFDVMAETAAAVKALEAPENYKALRDKINEAITEYEQMYSRLKELAQKAADGDIAYITSEEYSSTLSEAYSTLYAAIAEAAA